MEKVSIVVPVYNVEKYLKDCLDNIVNQTYQNLEIVLVDDGSTDNSGEICDQYALSDNRISVIHKQNGGLSDARNVGSAQSTGKYIAFVDSDDCICLDYIDTLMKNLINKKADIALCGFYIVDEQGLFLERAYKETRAVDVYSGREMLGNLLARKNEFKFTLTAWGSVIKREIVLKYPFPKGKYFEDVWTTYKFYNMAKKIVVINRHLYKYRVRENSITHSEYSLKNLDHIFGLEELVNFLESKQIVNRRVITLYFQRLFIGIKMIGLNGIDYDTSILYGKYYKYKRKYNSYISFKLRVQFEAIKFINIYKAYLKLKDHLKR